MRSDVSIYDLFIFSKGQRPNFIKREEEVQKSAGKPAQQIEPVAQFRQKLRKRKTSHRWPKLKLNKIEKLKKATGGNQRGSDSSDATMILEYKGRY